MAYERKQVEPVEQSGKPVEMCLPEIMRQAIERRDELNVFIRLLMNVAQGRDFSDDDTYK